MITNRSDYSDHKLPRHSGFSGNLIYVTTSRFFFVLCYYYFYYFCLFALYYLLLVPFSFKTSLLLTFACCVTDLYCNVFVCVMIALLCVLWLSTLAITNHKSFDCFGCCYFGVLGSVHCLLLSMG